MKKVLFKYLTNRLKLFTEEYKMTQKHYQTLNEICFRTPSLPFQAAQSLYETEFCSEKIHKLLENKFIYEAIYLASPSLINQLEKSNRNEVESKKQLKALLVFAKYILRMSTRPTPFGLFSGVFAGNFCNKTEIQIDTMNFRRRTRLGYDVLFLIYNGLLTKKNIREKLNFRLNTSLYRIGKHHRYIKSIYSENRKEYILQELITNETLEATLNFFSKPKSIPSYIDFMIRNGYLEEDCKIYLNDLIRRQILIADIHPYSVGEPYLEFLVKTLKEIVQESKETKLLSHFNNELKSFDVKGLNNKTSYTNLEKRVFELTVEKIKNPFQVDYFVTSKKATIDCKEIKIIDKGFKVLSKLSPPKDHQTLKIFESNLLEQYAGNPIKLVQALDADCGIGYPTNDTPDNYWYLKDLNFSEKERARLSSAPTFSEVEKMLLHKLNHNPFTNSIEITDEDLMKIPDREIEFPSSCYAMTERHLLNGKPTYYMPNISSNSATSLMGRFSGSSDQLDVLVEKICNHEQNIFDEALCVEIDHIPENRTGNILFRKDFRKNIIPYLTGVPSLSGINYININDIYISFQNGKLVLSQGINGKRIIPFLSNAHNFKKSSIPIYRFLCDFQWYFSNSELLFTWGSIANHRVHLPRVTYKDIILSKARWHISKKNFNQFGFNDGKMSIEAMEEFRKFWNLPKYVTLVQGDNLLYIDLSKKLGLEILFSEINKKEDFILEEFILSEDDSIKNQNNEGHLNQIIFTLLKRK